MSNGNISPAPVLALGVGNLLLGDDGVGIRLVNELTRWCSHWHGEVELFEGGTLSLALLKPLADRAAVVVLGAVAVGAAPGTLHTYRDEEVLGFGARADTVHESCAGELLRIAMLLGDLPAHLFLIGIEPARLESGPGLSEPVQRAIPAALEAARRTIE